MAESSSSGDEEFRGEPKYKQFSAAVERALKGFEVSSEWHDLISSLARLNKTLLAYKQYPAVPHQLLVSKRLSQCLHPNLPGGVHLKALDVYKAIFDRIGTKGLSETLLVYSSGLFPLLGHSSMSVRPSLLDIYERYYLAVGQGLAPCLPGMVLGLLPGLEDESEHTERILRLLEALCLATDEPSFYSALWQCILTSTRGRLPAVSYILSKLNKKATAEDQTQYLGGNLPLMVSGLCAALQDKSVLVSRATLDIILSLFPLHRPFLLASDVVEVLLSALETLLRRDMSLNRRLFSWLLGTQVDKNYMETHFPEISKTDQDTALSLYFDKFTKSYLLSALRSIIITASQATKHTSSRSDSVLPYRLLRSLMDKPEIGDAIVSDILPDLVTCLKVQVESLGGIPVDRAVSLKQNAAGSRPSGAKEGTSSSEAGRGGGGGKKSGRKSYKLEILQSANLFFNCLAPELLWQWMEALLCRTIALGAGDVVNDSQTITQQRTSGEQGLEEEGREDTGGERVPDVAAESLPSSPVYPTSPLLMPWQQSSRSGGGASGGGVQLSCGSACKLIRFLLQILPLEAMEDVYIHHLPHLCWYTLQTLCSQEPVAVKSRSLLHCLELIMFCVQKMLQEPSTPSLSTSLPTTPALTPTSPSLTAQQLNGAPLDPSAGSALTSHADKLKWKLLTQFSTFFSNFINNRIFSHCITTVNHTFLSSSVPSRHQVHVSGSVERCFVTGCQLLCVLAQLPVSRDSNGDDKDSTGTAWLPAMKSVCAGSHDYHMTFIALETLLTLLAYDNCSPATWPSCDVKTTCAVSALCPDVSTITKDTTFLEAVTQYLWDCLCPSLPQFHVEASSLLCWAHSLSPSHACETTLLRQFTSESIETYQRFTVLWQHSPSQVHDTPCKHFNRALLRMVAGLQSRDSAVRSLVQAWVHSATTRGELHFLIDPLVQIILEPNQKRKSFTGQPLDNKPIDESEKYYNSSAVSGKDDARLTQDEEMRLIYTQIFDSDQVLYALSLLQAVLCVDPPAVIRNLTCSVVSVPMYRAYGSVRSDLVSNDQPTGQKSILEVILMSLVSFIRSRYPDTLEVTPLDMVENLRVKSTAVEMIGFLMRQFSLILSSPAATDGGGDGSGGLVHNPSYVSALVTLCDVQKVLLLTLSQVTKYIRRYSNPPLQNGELKKEGTSDSGSNGTSVLVTTKKLSESDRLLNAPFRVLFVHILRSLQNLISLETQCIPSSPAAMTPRGKQMKRSLSSHHLIQPGLSTAAQPFFQSLLTDILANSSLSYLHPPLLHMFSAALPNLHGDLDSLAPRILRQLCRNLESSVQGEKMKAEGSSRESFSDGAAVVSNMQALVIIILWCLFGHYPTQQVSLKHNLLNRFWDVSQLSQIDDSEEAVSPASKQPTAMAWLVDMLTATQSKAASSPVGSKSSKPWLSQSNVGHSIFMLLPAVYNALTEVWMWFSGRVAPGNARGGNDTSIGGVRKGGRGVSWLEEEKKKAEYQDIKGLISSLLGPLAAQEPTTFFSSVSTVWLEWDLGSKVNPNSKELTKRRDAFIVMLHHIHVLSLNQFIRGVQFSFTDLASCDDIESSVLRRKYLLHFLYKYISSSLQSWEELAGCDAVMVMFLRDLYSQCYNGTGDSLLTNCHILCMLTSILHVFICRVPGLEKKQKKERKELQDLTHKLCEALSLAAGCSPLPSSHDSPLHGRPPPPHVGDVQREPEDFEVVEHSDLHRKHQVSSSESGSKIVDTVTNHRVGTISLSSGEGRVKGGEDVSSLSPAPSATVTSTDRGGVAAGHVRSAIVAPAHHPPVATMTTAARPVEVQPQKSVTDPTALPGTQALAVLASTVSHFIDGVFGSSEKGKILTLLKVILHNVWPHLQNHSSEAQKLHHHSVKLLSSLSGFQATRKAWRRETFDLFMADNFFVMELESLQEWRVLVDNLMTQDRTTFRDLLTRLTPGLTPGLSNIFTTAEQEALNTGRVVKRMAFAILSAETDQYTSYLPVIQEKLSDCLKLQRHPVVSSEVFLSFRTLLLKFSSTHLLSFWPAIVAETLCTLHELETDLRLELREQRIPPPSHLQLYLAVSKLLNTAWSLPSDFLPHFQFLQWGFSVAGNRHSSSGGHGRGSLHNICSLFSSVEGIEKMSHAQSTPGVNLQPHTITSLRDLGPFFTSFPPPRSSLQSRHHTTSYSSVEKELLNDFLEPFPSH